MAMKETSNIYCLVLSNGNYEGLGLTREKEMEDAATSIGLKAVQVIDDHLLKDGPWEWNEIMIEPYVINHIRKLG